MQVGYEAVWYLDHQMWDQVARSLLVDPIEEQGQDQSPNEQNDQWADGDPISDRLYRGIVVHHTGACQWRDLLDKVPCQTDWLQHADDQSPRLKWQLPLLFKNVNFEKRSEIN